MKEYLKEQVLSGTTYYFYISKAWTTLEADHQDLSNHLDDALWTLKQFQEVKMTSIQRRFDVVKQLLLLNTYCIVVLPFFKLQNSFNWPKYIYTCPKAKPQVFQTGK